MKFFKPFELPVTPAFPALSVNVRDYGARDNTKITEAIKAAIADVHSRGGGRVVVPAGHFYSGAIHLKSNIDLHFEKGCHLEFSTDFEDYLPVVFGILAGNRCYSPSHLLYAYRCENIAVTGEGVLDGHGEWWWPMKHNQPGMEDLIRRGKALSPISERVYDKAEDGVRPRMLQFVECENVLIEGITLKNSPSWTVHPAWCKNITVRNLKIRNPLVSPNTDGINLECCKRGLVEDCDVEGGDDMICLKAGRDEDAWDAGIPCEDIEVRRCHTKNCRGGLTIGSEMSAGIRNGYVHDCTLGKMSCFAIRMKTMKGRGGVVENLDVENITAESAGLVAISISMRYDMEPLDDQSAPLVNMPVFRNISINNVSCESTPLAIQLIGERGYELENICLSNINISSQNTPIILNVRGLNTENICIKEL